MFLQRKTSSSDENTEDAKKAKVENGSGDASVNGTNGKSTSPEKKPETAMETEVGGKEL